MKRPPSTLGIILALFALALVVRAVGGCYDANSPNLPPCDPRAPDPNAGCFDVPMDAGDDHVTVITIR